MATLALRDTPYVSGCVVTQPDCLTNLRFSVFQRVAAPRKLFKAEGVHMFMPTFMRGPGDISYRLSHFTLDKNQSHLTRTSKTGSPVSFCLEIDVLPSVVKRKRSSISRALGRNLLRETREVNNVTNSLHSKD